MDPTRDISDYTPTIEYWVRNFVHSMDSGPKAGDRSGEEPLGVKIIFDGYGYNEETGNQDDINVCTLAIFVHKDSLSGEVFPEHESNAWALVHRPKEEVCFWITYTIDDDFVDFNPFEDGDTELDHEFVYQLIRDLELDNYR